MEGETKIDSIKPMTLEESTKRAIARMEKMTKEEAIQHFKDIGMLTEDGEFAPQFQNLKYWRPAS